MRATGSWCLGGGVAAAIVVSILTSIVSASACSSAPGAVRTDGAAGGDADGGPGDVAQTADAAYDGAAPGDAGPGCEPFVMPDDCTIPEGAVLPGELRCTGLYGDWAARTLACGVLSYAPAYSLWADGADKQRFVWLPPGTQIDVSDPDDFQYPVGTSFWKEFRVRDADAAASAPTWPAETRLLRKVDGGWIYTTYVWSDDGTRAIQQNNGVANARGSGHTVPSRQQCKECHSGRPDFVLGWDALMLGRGSTGVDRDLLVTRDLVTWTGRASGAPSPLALAIPGDETEQAALGYLHANCGVSCHNGTTAALGREAGLLLRLDSRALGSVLETPAFATGLGRRPSPNAPIEDLPAPAGGGAYVDLRPLDPGRSLILARMKVRNTDAQMPRLATNRVDAEGVAVVQAWIEHMTPARGYPAAGQP